MNEEYMLRQQWLNLVTQYINGGRMYSTEQAIAEADKVVAAYRNTFPTNSETN